MEDKDAVNKQYLLNEIEVVKNSSISDLSKRLTKLVEDKNVENKQYILRVVGDEKKLIINDVSNQLIKFIEDKISGDIGRSLLEAKTNIGKLSTLVYNKNYSDVRFTQMQQSMELMDAKFTDMINEKVGR